ncbi:OsmC family protein [Wenyingzhuangia sp. IMCC45533]
MSNIHKYKVDLLWKGSVVTNKRFKYDKTYQIDFTNNKPSIIGSADAVFHGNADLYNPEEMLLSALSSCHMMSFFYLCSINQTEISGYRDSPEGILKVNANGSGQFESVTLQPTITCKNGEIDLIQELFFKAKEYCFIARSCNFDVILKPNFL